MNANTSYVVMTKHYEYDDEFFYPVGDVGFPVMTTTDRVKAQKRVDELNLEEWREKFEDDYMGDWFSSSYTSFSDMHESEAISKLQAAFPDYDIDINLDNFFVPKGVNDEQIRVLQEVFDFITFNYIVEVESE